MVKYARCATTIDLDSEKEIVDRVKEVFSIFLDENKLDLDDIKVVQMTITDDIHSFNPCTALRKTYPDIKACLFTSLEPSIVNSLKLAIRMLITFEKDNNDSVKHIYINKAKNLRKYK